MTEQTEPETELARKALAALREAVAKVIAEHRRENMPLAVWRDGKAVWVDPFEFGVIREETRAYDATQQGS